MQTCRREKEKKNPLFLEKDAFLPVKISGNILFEMETESEILLTYELK